MEGRECTRRKKIRNDFHNGSLCVHGNGARGQANGVFLRERILMSQQPHSTAVGVLVHVYTTCLCYEHVYGDYSAWTGHVMYYI